MTRNTAVPVAMLLAVIAVSFVPMAAGGAQEAPAAAPRESFVLWQIPGQTITQMMSYVIQTTHGKIIVIDGGTAGDAPYLAGFLEPLGNVVDAWFVSHPHSDHVDALREILLKPGGLKIHAIYGSLPDSLWVGQYETELATNTFRLFEAALAHAGLAVTELTLSLTLEIDGVRIEVLSIKNPEITQNALNNSSVVLRVSDQVKSVLFLGDLGVAGGEKLLKSCRADRLRADYVQMAHHGQNGVSQAFYERVAPTYCLWPTPKWLWDNDKGQGKGSGSWRTFEVRAWMQKIPPEAHYVMWEGLHRIE